VAILAILVGDALSHLCLVKYLGHYNKELLFKRKDVTKRVPFDPTDMSNPTLVVGNTFHDATKFRKVVRQHNILREKDLKFKKKKRKMIVIVCKDERCRYRVYGR
jgi:hypothetical protein